MVRKYHNHILHATPDTVRKSHRTSTVTSRLLNQRKEQAATHTLTNNERNTSKQQQSHRIGTDRSLSHTVGGGGLKCILLAPNFRSRLCCS